MRYGKKKRPASSRGYLYEISEVLHEVCSFCGADFSVAIPHATSIGTSMWASAERRRTKDAVCPCCRPEWNFVPAKAASPLVQRVALLPEAQAVTTAEALLVVAYVGCSGSATPPTREHPIVVVTATSQDVRRARRALRSLPEGDRARLCGECHANARTLCCAMHAVEEIRRAAGATGATLPATAGVDGVLWYRGSCYWRSEVQHRIRTASDSTPRIAAGPGSQGSLTTGPEPGPQT